MWEAADNVSFYGWRKKICCICSLLVFSHFTVPTIHTFHCCLKDSGWQCFPFSGRAELVFFFLHNRHFAELPPASLLNIFSANKWALSQPAVRMINSYLVTVMWPFQTDQHTVALCSQAPLRLMTPCKIEKQTAANREAFLLRCAVFAVYQPMCTNKHQKNASEC